MINVIRLLVGMFVLGLAAYSDVKTRVAPNWLWIILGPIGFGLLLFDLMVTDSILPIFIAAFMVFIFYVLFQLNIISGGADAKALMSIAWLIPYFVVDVFFFACVISILSIPIIKYFHMDVPLRVLLHRYPIPFLLSLFVGFICSFIVSNGWTVLLFERISGVL